MISICSSKIIIVLCKPSEVITNSVQTLQTTFLWCTKALFHRHTLVLQFCDVRKETNTIEGSEGRDTEGDGEKGKREDLYSAK